MGVTTIQWTATPRPDGTYADGFTFNPWHGCVERSAGCANCYARTQSLRNPAVLGRWGREDKGTRVVKAEAGWREPLKWDREARAAGERWRVFCASIADVFEDWQGPMLDAKGRVLHYNSAATWWVPEETMHGPITMDFVRERLFDLISETPNLDWLFVTKRPENFNHMLPWCRDHAGQYRERYWPNVWLGTTVENQEQADRRIPLLLKIPAAVRFLSVEPMLGPIDLGDWDHECGDPPHGECPVMWPDWVIVGGESGGKARPFDLAWARSLRDQCTAAGVPFFLKQMGARPFDSSAAEDIPGAHDIHHRDAVITEKDVYTFSLIVDSMHVSLKDSHGGDWDEWPEDLRVREFPAVREI